MTAVFGNTYNVVVTASDPEVRALLRAYLDALSLSENIQTRLWKRAQLTLAQVRVLHRLAPGPRTLGELGADLGLSPTSITRLMDRLEERGLVERRREGDDRRRVTAVLLPAGRDLVAALPLLRDTPIWEAAQRLSPQQRRRIGAAMREFVRAVLAVEAERPSEAAEVAAGR
jgi:DNA-binding MarR family transcriptional regulator